MFAAVFAFRLKLGVRPCRPVAGSFARLYRSFWALHTKTSFVDFWGFDVAVAGLGVLDI